MARRAALVLAVCVITACGSAPDRGAAPASPTPPPPPAPSPVSNQPPHIVSATIDPPLGVMDLATFTARTEATDPDGDPVTIAWSAPGRGVVATTAAFSFKAGTLSTPLTVTATDSRGGTATADVFFSSAGVDGFFDGYLDGRRNVMLYLHLSRTGRTVMGTVTLDEPGSPRVSHHGSLAPDEPGQIDPLGWFRFRLKFESENFTLEGRLEPYPEGGIYTEFLSNYVGRGRIIGGRFDGHSFIFGAHNPY